MNHSLIPKISTLRLRSNLTAIAGWLFLFALLVGVLLTRSYSYLLFHSVVEMFSIVIAFGIFVIAWNSDPLVKNGYLLILGIGSLFVAGVDALHMWAYKGMGVFTSNDANLPTQLWLAARYLQAFILLIAPFFLKRKINKYQVFLALAILTSLLLASIFIWDIFPTAYVENAGLTPFKIISEYMIIVILLAAAGLLWRNRSEFDPMVMKWLLGSIAAAIVAELFFTNYVGVTDAANLIGHIFKIIEFYLLYRALVVTGFVRPYSLILRQVKQDKDDLIIRENSTFDAISDLVSFHDVNYKLIKVNQAFAEFFGKKQEELVGKHCFEVFYGEDELCPNCPFSEAVQMEHSITEEIVNPRLRSPLLISVSPLFDNNGQLVGGIHIAKDITERKNAERALRASEERFRDLYENAPNAYFSVSVDGFINKCNRRAGELLAYEVNDLIGLPVIEMYADTPHGKEKAIRILQHFRAGGTVRDEELEMQRADGSSVWISLTVDAARDSKGRIVESRSMVLDITERKKAEDALQEERNLFLGGPNVAFRWRAAEGWPVEYVSPNVLDQFGYAPEDLTSGKVIYANIVHPDDLLRVAAEVEAHSEKKVPFFEQEYRLARADGEYRWIYDFTIVARDSNGVITHYKGYISDITERKRAEEDLRTSEEKFRTIIEQSSEGVTLIDETGLIVEWNQTNEKMTGIKRDQAIGLPLWDMAMMTMPPEQRTEQHFETFKTAVQEALKTGQSHLFTQPVEAAFYPYQSNEKRFLHQTIFPITTEKGYRIASLTHDITERKQAEIKANELAAIVQSSEDAIIGKTLDGIITSWNKGAEKIYGYTESEIVGQSISILIPPERAGEVAKLLDKTRIGEHIDHYETIRQRKDGNLIYVSLAVSPIKNTEGKIIAASTIGRDITERKRAEEEIARALEAEKRARQVAEILREASESLSSSLNLDDILQKLLHFLNYLVPYDSANVMLLEDGFNLRVAALHGYEQWTDRDKTQSIVFDMRETPILEKLVTTQKSMLIGNTLDHPGWVRMAGAEHVMNWLGIPVISSGQVIGVYSVDKIEPDFFTEEHLRLAEGLAGQAAVAIQNASLHEQIKRTNMELEQRVTDRTEQLQAANKELEAFAYSVSHDLRAPLRHIDGFIEMLQRRTQTSLDEKSQHYMEVIADSAKRMGTLIDDLLSFSRMGRNEMSTTQVDLGRLIQEVIQEFGPEIEERSIEWNIAALPSIMGDWPMLRMVLTNLISNALKFTQPREHPKIEIGYFQEKPEEIVFFIRDNGVGFDMNYADKLFGVFQRLHHQEDFEGTGIGLANVQRIIKRHGGRVWAEGKIDHGATFYFTIPASEQEPT